MGKFLGKIAIPVALLLIAWALFSVAHAQQVTPKVCPVVAVATNGTAVTAIPSRVNGGVIAPYIGGATDSNGAAIYVDQTGAAASSQSATSFPLKPNAPWFVIPNAGAVSVNAPTAQSFFCIMW